jgi:hypothetical protein
MKPAFHHKHLKQVTAMLDQCELMVVQTMEMSPIYVEGDVLFLHSATALPCRTRAALKLRSGKNFIGTIVDKRKGMLLVQSLDEARAIRTFRDADVLAISKVVASVHH